MKKIIVMLIAVFSFSLLTAQEDLVEITYRVMELDPSDNILEAFGMDLSEFDEENNDVVFDESFNVSNEEELLGMFSRIVDAREGGLLAANIWDNFGVGRINKDNLVDGKIDVGSFIDGLPGVGDRDVDMIGSEFGNKRKRPGSGRGSNSDMMDPSGGLNGGSSGYMGDGLGNSYKNGNNGTGGSNMGNNGGNQNGNSDYNGQMGSDNGSADYDRGGYGTGGNGGRQNGGMDNDPNTQWSVDATNSSYKHSGADGYSSFTHHHSTVSNDKGYSSTTDKQSNRNSDGSGTTRIVVTQTQSDGSSKTVVTITSTDADGNTHTTRTTTEKDSDGEVTNQETEESDDGDNSSCERPDDGSYDDRSTPPSDEEKESAVWRAVMKNGFAGGRGDDRTGQSDRNEMSGDFSPMELQNKKGYMEPKSRGGKVNASKINIQEQVTNPGVKNR